MVFGKRLALVVAAVCVAGWMSSLEAAVLVRYGFDGNSPNPTATPTANVSASTITIGTGVNPAYSETGNAAPSLAIRDATTTSESAAVAANAYISLTLTPASGYQLDLSNLTVDLQTSNVNSPPRSVFLRSSVDAYTATLGTAGFGTPPAGFSNGAFTNFSFDLSSLVGVTTPVTLRLYYYNGGTGSPASDSLRNDNVTVNGAVSAVVPEPVSAGMVVAGMPVVMRRRR